MNVYANVNENYIINFLRGECGPTLYLINMTIQKQYMIFMLLDLHYIL
jgi:hypothetical protein